MKNLKNKMTEEVWSSYEYYKSAHKGSLDMNHEGMEILANLSINAKRILDLGCGEGTRLNALINDKQAGVGVDISQKALVMAKKKYSKIRFIKADLENIPLPDNSFDLVYSAYVFDHLINPSIVIKEAIRLTSKEGFFVIIAPNYGAPNRVSPPFKGSRIKKFSEGLFKDFMSLIIKERLEWKMVTPIADKSKYELDWDTTIEPYLGSLLNYISFLGLKVNKYSSCWSAELPNAKFHQKVFKLLGNLDIFPFNMWGPHLVLVVKKVR